MVKPWFPDLLDGSEVRDHSQAWQIRVRATVLEIGLRAKRETVSLLCLTSLNPTRAIRAVSAHLASTGIQSWNPNRQLSKRQELQATLFNLFEQRMVKRLGLGDSHRSGSEQGRQVRWTV